MSSLKISALAVAVAGTVLAFAPADAQAQGYGHRGYGHHQPQYHYAPQPQYVHPKILRKQAQMQERVYEKYGYSANRYYGYDHPSYRRQNYGYNQPSGNGFYFSW